MRLDASLAGSSTVSWKVLSSQPKTATLPSTRTDDGITLLEMEMGAGHGGPSGAGDHNAGHPGSWSRLIYDYIVARWPGRRHIYANGAVAATVAPDDYIGRVKRAEVTDPVLTAHLHDGWDVITAIRGYLPHDEESAGWAAVIQWLNPECPPPAQFDLSRVPRKA